jgi:hypothetical protein
VLRGSGPCRRRTWRYLLPWQYMMCECALQYGGRVRLAFFEEASDHCLLDVGRKDAQVGPFLFLEQTRTGDSPDVAQVSTWGRRRMRAPGQLQRARCMPGLLTKAQDSGNCRADLVALRALPC